MIYLLLRLFDGFHAETNTGSVLSLPTDKIRGLLVYLTMESDQPQRREKLAGLLWPEWENTASLRNLRQALYRLRQALDNTAPGLGNELLTITRQDITLHSRVLRSDVDDFWRGVNLPYQHRHTSLAECSTCRSAVSASVDLYQGELLAGHAFEDAPEYVAWLSAQRQRYHLAYLAALSQLAECSLIEKDFAAAYTYAIRQLGLEPWREVAHRQAMTALLGSGQRVGAIEQYHLCRSLLAEELGVDPEPETEALYLALLEPDEPVTHPPRSVLNNLPNLLTTFVGRQEELGQLAAHLSAGRLLTLTGPGGMGKTRLAIEAAQQMLDQFPDGVWLVELADLGDAGWVNHAIAQTLGMAESEDRLPLHRLADFLTRRRLLLLVDNCEHLLGSCAQTVEHLLTRCPNLRVLATSREPLGIPGEQIWPLAPLALPPMSLPPTGEKSPEDLLAFPSLRLFVDRAASHRPGFRLDAQNMASILAICHRLDGMPLALELAAARVRTLSPARIAAMLDERFSLLTGGSRTALPRQQTLRSLVDWSYDLLTPAEQTLFRRMALFAGGALLDGVEAVCADDSSPGAVAGEAIFDLLQRLVDKSMLFVRLEGDETRYGMLETIRAYGLDRLSEAEEVERFARGHAHFYAALAAQAEPELVGGKDLHWITRLGQEEHNLRAALHWCFEFQRSTGGVAERESRRVGLGIRLAGCLSYFWDALVRLDDARYWLNLAWESVDAQTPAVDQARLASGLGTLAWRCGRHDEARRWHEMAAQGYRQAGDGRGEAFSTYNLAIHYAYGGDWTRSLDFHRVAIDLAEEISTSGMAALFLASYGSCLLALERNEEADPILVDAIERLRRAGSIRALGYALTSLIDLRLASGQIGQSEDAVAELADVARQTGDLSLKVGAWMARSLCLQALGHSAEAFSAAAQGLRIYRETQADVFSVQMLEYFAYTLGEVDRVGAALLLLQVCDQVRQQWQDRRSPNEQKTFNGYMDRIRATLPVERIDAIQRQAANMTLHQALAYAQILADDQQAPLPPAPRPA
jgi:predicted ATPase/DNA-binding SARP family transcriptional activator